MKKKSFLTPLGLVRQYNSPKPYCSPSIIIQGNFHLSKHLNERFDRFFHFSLFPYQMKKIARHGWVAKTAVVTFLFSCNWHTLELVELICLVQLLNSLNPVLGITKNLLNELCRKVVSEESWQSSLWRRLSRSSYPRIFLSP